MKIVFLGDSLTYGYGVRRKSAWVTMIDEQGEYEAVNKGINGDTTGGMLARFKSDVLDLNPNIVHIMGGANDIICDANEDMIKPNIMAMIHQAQASGIKPILGLAPSKFGSNIAEEWNTFSDFNRVEQVMMKYREWLFKFCYAFNLEYIDYHSKILEHLESNAGEELFLDGLHFSEVGNRLMADIFLDYLRDKRQTL
ncbi:MAG: SGNH/GDSL hydrolase family protein [Bacillota bacterium]|nr:SGNH/GDSL hydrolase family protein [Bacillota bacterium]